MASVCRLVKLLVVSLLPVILIAGTPELRGVWLAWASATPPTKDEIAQTMDLLAGHNLNTVYVDVWRFGYPYFQSNVFHELTGLYTDPRLAEGRDFLQEIIAEGHRNGLEICAWFEAGFAATYESGSFVNQDLYLARPNWFAKKRDGSGVFVADGTIVYRWLAHSNPDAQQFLIDMCEEVARKYDVDGIELDRVRYPELDCGFDDYTKSLYQSEKGTAPPDNIYDATWMKWRADELTEFMANLYDSVKAVNPNVIVSNAPLPYTWGYDNFCQDWAPWINDGNLDVVSPQLYYSYLPNFLYDLNRNQQKVTDVSKMCPGIAIVTNGVTITPDNLFAEIDSVRNRGMSGHVIWYHQTIAEFLDTLKAVVYPEKVAIPGRADDWRIPTLIIDETNLSVVKTSGWKSYSGVPGYHDGCLYAGTTGVEQLDYVADIPKTGWYEVYAFVVQQAYATTRVPFVVYHQNGIDTIRINQTLSGDSKWTKLGDFHFSEGTGQCIIQISNLGIDNRFVFADAVMLLKSNRPEEYFLGIHKERPASSMPKTFSLLQNYPNPFNACTIIPFRIDARQKISLKVFDLKGNEILEIPEQTIEAGFHSFQMNAEQVPSGIYFYQLQVGSNLQTRKMAIIR